MRTEPTSKTYTQSDNQLFRFSSDEDDPKYSPRMAIGRCQSKMIHGIT